MAKTESERAAIDVSARMPLWSRVEQANAVSRGQGTPIPRWAFQDGGIEHREGHRSDFLYLNVPFRGDFELSYDVSVLGNGQIDVVYAGIEAVVQGDRKSCVVSTFGRNPRRVPLDPPLEPAQGRYECRIAVKDRTFTYSVQGRKLVDEPIPPGNDPWLAIHENSDGHNLIRNLKVVGTPEVPDSLDLTLLPDLSGWLADYYAEPLDGDSPAWARKGEEIVGANIAWAGRPARDQYGNVDSKVYLKAALPGSKQESLLQYHRPMLEDGTIAYEFFYEPGQSVVHPTLDRLSFVLDPSGVKIHWRTDAQDDRTGLSPENLADEPENRRGPDRLPLKAGEWNRMALGLAGDDVTLTLNGTPIYARTLEPSNNRQFGLFHYADESEARVRHVTYDGRWPRALPPGLGLPAPAGGPAGNASGN
jgi:hypothetical protein